ncbi:MAG: hypothetical protein JF593_12140 [Novosphingobium sp.]|nr:hypothetical protein [Novosphingobium sp.]
MKNVTIALDDETYRKARIRAAELGTSLSALVKQYLTTLGEGEASASAGVREMPMTYQTPPQEGQGPPWLVNGEWVWTKDGKPRQPGSMRGLKPLPLDFDEWPADILESFEAWPYDDPDYKPMPFDPKQLPPK